MHAGLPTAQTTSGAAITALGETDLEGALALVAESGWNQVRADWQLFTGLGAAFKLTAPSGQAIATAATLPFARFGWISMVLVAKTQRRQGIATMPPRASPCAPRGRSHPGAARRCLASSR